MRLDLKVRRRQWGIFGVVLLLIGVPFAIAAGPLLLVALVDQNGGALVGAVLGVLVGSVAVPAGLAAERLSRSHPVMVVTHDGLTIEHPGLFTAPVHLPRSAVHSVYVQPFPGREPAPKLQGTAWQRLRQASHEIDRRAVGPNPLPISAWHCPDLSVLYTSEDHNLLVVMANSRPMRDVTRRGLGALSLAVARGFTFTGPTRATVARGFFAAAVDEAEARRAFETWPTAETPDPQLWGWLYAGSNRGSGWRGWRSRRRTQVT